MIDKPGELGREFAREITRKAIRRERRGEKENLNSLEREMKNVSRRTAEEMINVKDTTGYDFSESDSLLFGKRPKFSPLQNMSIYLQRHEDFLDFSRKLRLKVYFHNRDSENGRESDHSSVRE